MQTLDLYEFHSSWHATENYVYTRALFVPLGSLLVELKPLS